MTYTKRAARGIGFIFVLNILANAASYFTRLVLARTLEPAEYGLFYAVFSFIVFLSFFRGLGLGEALVKFIAEDRVRNDNDAIKTSITAVMVVQFLSSLVLAAGTYWLSPWLARTYFKAPAAEGVLQVLSLYLLVMGFYLVFQNVLNGFQKYSVIAWIECSRNTIVLVVILIGGALGLRNVIVPAWGYVVSVFVMGILLLPFVQREFNFFKYRIAAFRKTVKRLVLFGIPVMLTTMGGLVIGYIDVLLLTYFRPLEEVGIYNVILPSAMLFLYLTHAVSYVVLPMSSELWEKRDIKRLANGLRLMHKYAFVFILPLVFTVFVFSGWFIHLFFGREYVGGATALQILLVGTLCFTVAKMNNLILTGIGRQKTVTGLILAAALVNVIANIVLIPRYGLAGAASATALSYFVALLLSTRFITRSVKVSFPVLTWLKIAVAGVVFVGVVTVTKNALDLNPWIELVISTGAALLVYAAVLYVLRVLDIRELKKYFSLAVTS